MARRDDPDFERRMHATIYGTPRPWAAPPTPSPPPSRRCAAPSRQFEHDMAAAMAAPPPRSAVGPAADARSAAAPAHGDDDPWGD